MPQMAHVATGELIVFLSRKLVGRLRVWTHTAQGPEEMCLSLEYQNPSKTSEKWVILIALQFRYTFYRPQTRLSQSRSLGFLVWCRNAGLSISLPHWRQMFSGTATRIKVLVGVFSSSIPNHWSMSRGAKSILTVWQAALHSASWEVRAKMTSLDVIRCKGNKSSFRSLALRATRSKARLVSKSNRKPRDWGLAGPSGDVPCASEDDNMACGYWFSKWRTTKSISVR